ncbi:hypothetical protein AAF712_016629 [Marasmius tenuissimus]|uniref:Fungal STAND N-terminal Goodbye domain-containing protein n=1 Tax=Marasmius tenuissimus TaxID=585030 RepID=A0ABR2Z7D3_9AGAR|nr:hypothetical protein PM082_013990 [Marasmius tenuissimus]
MATQTAAEPGRLKASLRDLADGLRVTDNKHSLLEVADHAYLRMADLMAKDPEHRVDERGYQGFYKVVQNIIDLLENQQNTNSPPEPTGSLVPGWIKSRRPLAPNKRQLKKELKREFKKASGAVRCKWENALILAGGAVSMISTVPGLALLKPIGTVVGQLGELIKTIHSNKDECEHLLYLATRHLVDLSGKMQDHLQVQTQPDGAVTTIPFKPTENMKRDIEAFRRTLTRVCDYITKLEYEPRFRRFQRRVLASTTKEELAAFRKELEDARSVFTTGNIWAIHFKTKETHDTLQSLAKTVRDSNTSRVTKEDLSALGDAQTKTMMSINRMDDTVRSLTETVHDADASRVTMEDLTALGEAQMKTMTSTIIRVDDAVRSFNEIVHDGDVSRLTKEDLAFFEKALGNAQVELATSVRLEMDGTIQLLNKTAKIATFNLVGFLYGGLGGGPSRVV